MSPAIIFTAAFLWCHAITAKWEGGWSNDPVDPGGPTMYGIIQRVYDAWRKAKGLALQSVKKITRDEALDIFYTNYWLAAGCNRLFAGVDLAVYDAAVNSGPGRARKWLLKSVGAKTKNGHDDHAETVRRICAKRKSFVQGLRTFWRFGKGWINRITDVEAKGVARATAAMYGTAAVKPVLEQSRDKSAKTARRQTQAGATTGTATGVGGADAVTNPEHVHLIGDWLATGLIVAGCVLVAVLIYKSFVNRRQAEAYATEAANA